MKAEENQLIIFIPCASPAWCKYMVGHYPFVPCASPAWYNRKETRGLPYVTSCHNEDNINIRKYLFGSSGIIHREDKGEGRDVYKFYYWVYKAGGGGSRTSKKPIEGILGMCRLNHSTEDDSDNLGEKGGGKRYYGATPFELTV